MQYFYKIDVVYSAESRELYMLSDCKFKKVLENAIQVQLIEYTFIKILLVLQVTFNPSDPEGFPKSFLSPILSDYVIVSNSLLSISALGPVDSIKACQHDF